MSHYLTARLPGTGGILRREPADFMVEEVPLYEPGITLRRIRRRSGPGKAGDPGVRCLAA